MLGRIYKISGGGKFYIGSTTEILVRRLKHHRGHSREQRKMNSDFFKHFLELGWDNATIELIEEIEVETRKQLLERENIHIREGMNDDMCLNMKRPVITEEERKATNKTSYDIRRKADPEKENRRQVEWRKNNPEKYRAQVERVKERMRNKVVEEGTKSVWRRNHPEKYAEEKKRTAEKNKERLRMKKNLP